MLQGALLTGLLELVYKYQKQLAGITEEEDEQEVDASGQKFESITELMKSAAAERAARRGTGPEILEEEKIQEVSGYAPCVLALPLPK